MSFNVPASELNRMFVERLSTTDGINKIAAASQDFIRDRLREDSFFRKIINPQNVTRADCQISVNHDTLIKIIPVEPDSRAMAVTFRGEPTAQMIKGYKAEAAFFTIASEKYEKTEQELLAYDYPVTQVIERNVTKDIQTIEDLAGLTYTEAGIQALQTEANSGTPTAYNATNVLAGSVASVSVIKGELALNAGGAAFTNWPVQRPDLINLFNLMDGNKLQSKLLLMTEPDFNNVLQWTLEDFGDKITSETVVEGYKYNTLLGRKFIRTIKTDILRQGNVYLFTDPEFFGKFYVLNNTKFYADKRFNRIQWMSWEDIAIAIVNIASSRKLELYEGSVTPTVTDTGFEAKIPTPEADLNARPNNRVAENWHYPAIMTY